MRFLTSRFGLLIISFLFIGCLLWITLGNSILSSPTPGQEDMRRTVVNKLSNFFSTAVKWIYDMVKPIATEFGKSFNAWWETQKPIIVDRLIKWIAQSESTISAGLVSLLQSAANPVNGSK